MVVNPLIENEQILSCIGFALLVLRSVAICVAKISGPTAQMFFPPDLLLWKVFLFIV